MKTEGWIKIYKKTLNNPIWLRDRTAWFIFEYLMLTCDYKTGKRTYGRFQLSEILDINPTTIYKAIKRLEKAKMVTQVSNNRFTEVSICNWSKYQSRSNNASNNKVTTDSQQSNTNKEYKNIRNKEKESIHNKFLNNFNLEPFKRKFSNIDIQVEYEKACDFLLSSGNKYKDYPAFFRNWLRRSQKSNPQAIDNPVDKKVDIREISTNPLYREWCYLKEPRPKFKEWAKNY